MPTLIASLRASVRTRLLEETAMVTPAAPLVSPQGTPGASAWGYRVVATNTVGHTEAGLRKSLATGALTLDGTNFNALTWTAVPGATGYDVYRTDVPAVGGSPTTIGKIGSTAGTSFNDTGLAGDLSTPPAVNTSGLLAPFWSDAELTQILLTGCRDLWRAIIDLHQGHFITIDETNVSLTANATQLTGVPVDCFRVLGIESRDLTAGTSRGVLFWPKSSKSAAFSEARAIGAARDPSQGAMVFYDILNAGSPVAAPLIVIAPRLSTAVPLRLTYVHTLAADLSDESDNPIPGESDNALIAWGVAFARAKEREDRSPDPAHLGVYATDKQALLTALTPRQEQEEEVVPGMFESYW